jgi:tetratricopeptide (TPR) repeat protein
MQKVCLIGLMSCFLATGQTPAKNADVSMEQVRADMAKGDLARARMEAEALHAANPGDVEAALLLANCYIKMNRASEAVDVLMPLEGANSSNQNLEYSLAFGEIQSGREQPGVLRMERVAEATHSANAWMVAGAAHLQRNELAKSKADLDRALALNAHLPGLNTLAGQVRHALEDPDAAAPFFELALKENPRDFIANMYLGRYRMMQGDYGTARSMLELAVQLAPNSPLARLDLAELRGLTGHFEEAVKEFESLERETPDWIEPHIRLAALYYKVHRPEDGERERGIVEQMQAKQEKAGPNR